MDIKLKNKKTIRKRILTSMLWIFVIMFVMIMISFSILSTTFLAAETRQEMRAAAILFEKNIEFSLERLRGTQAVAKFNIFRNIELLDGHLKMETLILDEDKNIIYPVNSEWNKVKIASVRDSNTARDYIWYPYPIESEMIKNKSFELSGSSYKVDSLLLIKKRENTQTYRNLGIRAFLLSIAISGTIGIIIMVLTSRRITKPISQLLESMRLFNKDKTPVKVYHSNDEIEDLANSFSEITKTITRVDKQQKTFFQNSSHELKTPLMSIQGYAEAIKDGVVEGDDLDNSLDIIIAETQRLKNIVDDVIYLSKIDNMEDTFDIREQAVLPIIEDAVDVVTPLLQVNDLQVTIQCDPTYLIKCDRDKMVRVFINLIGNGSRYAKTRITVNVNQHQGHTYIDVIDDGKGFEFGQEEKVFDRFFNGKNGGSGIGLSLTKEIIEKHGGSIKAINHMNFGAVFKIEL
jgi:signal transduction histidine kinase